MGRIDNLPVHTRATLHARIADVLRRSGVADAEQLVRLMEQDAAEVRECLHLGFRYIERHTRVGLATDVREYASEAFGRLQRCLLGAEIGPPK